MNKFFFSGSLVAQQHIKLSPEESKHAVAVLRLGQGTAVHILNGMGQKATGSITQADKMACGIYLDTVTQREKTSDFTLLISPPKSSDRWAFIIEKAQELNVSCIQPVISHHSERKKINLEKAQNIAHAALKQSGAFFACTVKPCLPFKQALDLYPAGLFGYCKQLNPKNDKKSTRPTIFIGPEGDFSEREAEILIQKGWKTFTLAQNILRSETAALVAIVQYNPYL